MTDEKTVRRDPESVVPNRPYLEAVLGWGAKELVAWVQARIDQIEAELSATPSYRKRFDRFHPIGEERRALLGRLDAITRPREKWAHNTPAPRSRSSMLESRSRTRAGKVFPLYQDYMGNPIPDLPRDEDGKRWEPPMWGEPSAADRESTGVTRAILENGGLATGMAGDYWNGASLAGIDWPELTQAAQLGLAEAVATHDPDKGPIGPWAALCIRREITRLITQWVRRPRPVDTAVWSLADGDHRLLDSPDRRREAMTDLITRLEDDGRRLLAGEAVPVGSDDLDGHEMPAPRDTDQACLGEQWTAYDDDHPILGKENRQMKTALRSAFGDRPRNAGDTDLRDPDGKSPQPTRVYLDVNRHAEYRQDRMEVALARIARTDPKHADVIRRRFGIGRLKRQTEREVAADVHLGRDTIRAMTRDVLLSVRSSIEADEGRIEKS